MPFNVREEDWEFALSYLSGKPDGSKLRRKDKVEQVPGGACQNSFIIFNNVVYAMARNYLGKGAYSKVKLCQDKNKKVYALKIQNAPDVRSNPYEDNELIIEQDLELLIAAGKRTSSEKKIHIIKYLGTALNHYLNEKEKSLPIIEIISIFIRCVTEVIQFNNGEKSKTSKKYLHRDIKIENFVIDEQGKVSLIDFGFSCLLPNNGIVKDEPKGTPDCIAPEIWQGTYSLKTEIYALGVLLLEMVRFLPQLREDPDITTLHRNMRSRLPQNRPSAEVVLSQLHQWINNKSQPEKRLGFFKSIELQSQDAFEPQQPNKQLDAHFTKVHPPLFP